ncbi:MAG: hypothetical protein GY807_11055 [Gammaproteobacteria bacterium]|nr:hypothetical protein [Gammaproteobacteria bacterium]
MGQYIDFNYVKTHANFYDVLAYYKIKVRGKGDEIRCHCPFHDDDRPSMTINTDKRVFDCKAASCGESGNILDFVRAAEIENGYDLSLRDAAAKLADICNIDVAAPKKRKKNGGRRWSPEKRRQNQQRQTEAAGETEDLAQTANDDKKPERYFDQPPYFDDGDDAVEDDGEDFEPMQPLGFKLKLDQGHEYGQERGLSASTIARFEMGYCSRGLMKNRWCIPLHDSAGELIGYCGRWVDDELSGDEPRYKMPPDFNTRAYLFNLHRVCAMGHNQVVIVEGIFDAIRLHEMGVPAVALLGTSMSATQAELLGNVSVTATVMLDGGADKARMAVVDRLAQVMFVRSVMLPAGEDPASVDECLFIDRVPRVA